MATHHVLDMKQGDVIVIFDIRRYEQIALRMAEIARAEKMKVVLFTDQWASPVVKHATHSIHARIHPRLGIRR